MDQREPVPTDAIGYEVPSRNPSAVLLGIVGLKLMGVWLAIGVVTNAASLITYAQVRDRYGDAYPMHGIYVSVGVQALAALLLLVATRSIASFVLGRLPNEPLSVGPLSFMKVAVAAIGLALIVFSLDEGIRGAIILVERLNANLRVAAPRQIEPAELLQLLLPFARIGVGLLLFLGPGTIVGRWPVGRSIDHDATP